MILQDQGTAQVIRTIMDRALQTRPKTDVHYRPFQPCPFVRYVRALGSLRVDLDAMYPEAKEGDSVIADFCIRCLQEEEIYLNVSGNVCVWYEKQLIYDGRSHEKMEERQGEKNGGNEWDQRLEEPVHLPIRVKTEKENPVRILCEKRAEEPFAFEVLLSVKRYPGMWANDYLFWARAVLPMEERAGEEGIALSQLFHADEWKGTDDGWAAISYAWPPLLLSGETFPPGETLPQGETFPRGETFDFRNLCQEGDVCYVYSEAARAHRLSFCGTAEEIWVNGMVQKDSEPYLEKGDRVLIRCRRRGDDWYLSLDTANLVLPFLQSGRKTGDKAIFAGPFCGTQCHGPEYEWDFSKVFVNAKGEPVYWRFCDGSELRAYLDSVFFGQWFYALMVGFYGIRDAAACFGDRERQRLFCENMSMLAAWFDYIQYDIRTHVMPAFMPRTAQMNVLDNIGTMGMNLIDAYLDSNDRNLLPLIDRIRYQAEETIPRLADGTYYRVDTMWADDLYMSCPFLVRMGRLTKDSTWFQKAAQQICGFRKRLYMEDEHLFSHIYFSHEERANRVPWGRGNGWVMWTLSEFLMYGEGHVDVSKEKQLFYEMAHRIRELQDESGLWHQVLNRTEEGSYLETSCTGMFLLAFARGVRYGWLERDFLDTMERAWKGLLTHSIDKRGNVYGVCMGSGCAMEAEYYFSIPTICNDDHGTGVILAAGSEYWELRKELEGEPE